MHKRGLSQVDWVISIGMFLLYIAWFFIFIRPLAVQGEAPNLVETLKEKVNEEAYWSVFDYPIIVESEYDLTNEPIITPTPLDGESNFFMQNRSFFFHMNHLFFLSNLNIGQNNLDIIGSNEDYLIYNQITELIADSTYAASSGITVEFENNLIKSVDYSGPKIFSYDLFVNENHINPSNVTFYKKNIAVLYPIQTQIMNVTTIVFAYNPRVYILFEGEGAVRQEFELNNYDSYHLTGTNNGAISVGGCYEDYSDMVEFTKEDKHLLFAFDNEAHIYFCRSNNSIDLEIEFQDENMIEKIVFYDSDSFQRYRSPYTSVIGIPDQITALSMFNLKTLNVTKYSLLKQRWSLGDFRVVVSTTNNSEVISFGGTPYGKATVYAEEKRDYILDKYGDLDDVLISIQSWT